MADDLVVLHEDAEGFSQSIIAAANSDSGWGPHEVNLARAYLAVVAERDAFRQYARHKESCPMFGNEGIETYCDCGLAAALAATGKTPFAKRKDDAPFAGYDTSDWPSKRPATTEAKLRAQLAAMTAERDDWKGEYERRHKDVCDQMDECIALKLKLTAREAARERLHVLVHHIAISDKNGWPYKEARDLLAALAAEPERDNWKKSCVIAIAERDALRTLVERINGRAQVPKGPIPADMAFQKMFAAHDALRDIREWAQKELGG